MSSDQSTEGNQATNLNMLVAAVPDFVYTFDLDGRFTYANLALHRLLQKEPGQMVGLNFHDLQYPEPLASTLQQQIQEVIDTKGMVRAETPFGDGYYEYIFVPILTESGRLSAVAGTTRDITARRRMEIQLRESQAKAEHLVAELQVEREKLQNLFQLAPAFIATLAGPEFIFEFANEDYNRLVGYRDIIGKSVLEALPEVAGQGFIELLQGVFLSGQSFVGRGMGILLAGEDGETQQRYMDFVYQAIKDATGSTTGILVHGVDVTDQVIAREELNRLNEELESRVEERTLQLQIAIRELEGFSYSVSHDLRAPLRAIVSSSKILIDDFGSELSLDARYELSRQALAANKLAVLIDELLKLSRLARQDVKRVSIDVTALVWDITAQLSVHHQDNGCIFEVEPGMTAVADRTSLHLLLLNLIENACKFSAPGSKVEVGQARSKPDSVFFVKDQGEGFDMAYAEKVFLPFERLVSDQDYAGTGIGLANVKRIVDRHKGRVWVETGPKEGATFYFTLGT